jgi:hypothetical protein
MVAGCGYVADSFAELAAPQFVAATTRITAITNFCEVPIILWLLIWGARPRGAVAQTTGGSSGATASA